MLYPHILSGDEYDEARNKNERKYNYENIRRIFFHKSQYTAERY